MSKAPSPAPVPTPPAPAPTPAPAAQATPVADAFQFEDAASFTKPVKAASAIGKGVVTEATKKLMAVPVGKTFLVPVEFDNALPEGDERNKAFADAAGKEKTRVKGSARRLVNGTKDTSHALKNFTIEIVSSAELGYGVRVWRDEDTVTAAA